VWRTLAGALFLPAARRQPILPRRESRRSSIIPPHAGGRAVDGKIFLSFWLQKKSHSKCNRWAEKRVGRLGRCCLPGRQLRELFDYRQGANVARYLDQGGNAACGVRFRFGKGTTKRRADDEV